MMISEDIKMEFRLDKCAKATFRIAKKIATEGMVLNDSQVIQHLD